MFLVSTHALHLHDMLLISYIAYVKGRTKMIPENKNQNIFSHYHLHVSSCDAFYQKLIVSGSVELNQVLFKGLYYLDYYGTSQYELILKVQVLYQLLRAFRKQITSLKNILIFLKYLLKTTKTLKNVCNLFLKKC